jgi:hypothetical protein
LPSQELRRLLCFVSEEFYSLLQLSILIISLLRLPEIKADLPGKHAMSRSDEAFPTFENVNGEQCLASLGKITLEYETGLWKLEDSATGKPTIF